MPFAVAGKGVSNVLGVSCDHFGDHCVEKAFLVLGWLKFRLYDLGDVPGELKS